MIHGFWANWSKPETVWCRKFRIAGERTIPLLQMAGMNNVLYCSHTFSIDQDAAPTDNLTTSSVKSS
jgi:hypothetical protein